MILNTKSLDKYMESKFGKADYSRAIYNQDDGLFHIPLGNKYRIWKLNTPKQFFTVFWGRLGSL